MQKTFLTLVSSVLKWGKQSIRKAKWGDCVMSREIREDADLWSGLCLRSQTCSWPAGTHPAQGSFMCPDFRMREESCGYALSLSPVPLPCPSIFFQRVYICTYIFHMDHESWLCIMATEYYITFSRAEKAYTLSCQIKSLPKWSKLMRRFVNYR